MFFMSNTTNNIVKPNITGKFTFEMPIRWGDLDAQNHVNNVVYFRYFEEARIQMFNAAGLDIPGEVMLMLANINCDFVRPIEYPNTLLIENTVKKIGNTSMTYESIIRCKQDTEIVYAKSSSVVVCANAIDAKPTPWTQGLLDSFAKCFV